MRPTALSRNTPPLIVMAHVKSRFSKNEGMLELQLSTYSARAIFGRVWKTRKVAARAAAICADDCRTFPVHLANGRSWAILHNYSLTKCTVVNLTKLSRYQLTA